MPVTKPVIGFALSRMATAASPSPDTTPPGVSNTIRMRSTAVLACATRRSAMIASSAVPPAELLSMFTRGKIGPNTGTTAVPSRTVDIRAPSSRDPTEATASSPPASRAACPSRSSHASASACMARSASASMPAR